jgi:tRNA pseudouridine55 synthase
VDARHGLLILDKPAGVTSAQAIADIKRRFGRKTKVGHAGTLDPFATGVLLVLVGDATRLSNLAMALPKTYVACVRFGWQTDTLDPDGQVVAEADPGSERDLTEVVQSFVGEIEQTPPAFSALKIDGDRAYKLARKGETPALESRTVVIHEIGIEDTRWPEVSLRIVCGAGTYVRALARDLGQRIGLPASLTRLRRTAIGPFRAEAAGETLCAPMSIVEAAGLPIIRLTHEQARAFASGRTVPGTNRQREDVAIVMDTALVGLGHTDDQGILHPSTVLAAARRRIEESR